MVLHLAYPWLLYTLAGLLVVCTVYKFFTRNKKYYVYPLASALRTHGLARSALPKYVLMVLRFCLLALLAFLTARPQWVDEHSKVNVEGIDIVIALDVSGSMQCFDDQRDQRQRIEVAKTEAIHFIDKRPNDPIGLVIFAKDALSRCPLTLDKPMLKELVGELELGIIDHTETYLGTGLATAVNRLKKSKAKSKIIILLTDGAPSPGEKISPELAIQLAQTNNIKVYTVGIGGEHGGFIMHPLLGMQQFNSPINTALLKEIATKTGGAFFLAKNPADMRTIYNTIDKLEKTDIQTNVYHNYYEAFAQFIWLLLAILCSELLLRLLIWRGAL